MKKKVILIATALMPIVYMLIGAQKLEDIAVSKTAQAINLTQAIDVSPFEHFSVQAVYSDGTPSSINATGGTKSISTMTVTAANAGVAKRSAVSITVSSNGVALTGAIVTLNGIAFTEGIDWAIGSTNSVTAMNISDAIDAKLQFISTYNATGYSIIYASATDTGTLANGWSATVSTVALTLSADTFTGGTDNGVITIGTTQLVQGVDWTAGATTALTAKAISDAIMANTTLSGIFISTHSAAIVTATSTINGAFNYGVDVPSGITAVNFTNGTASDISVSGDSITKTSHGFTTGLAILYSTTAPNVQIGGLSNGVTYYAVKSTNDVFQLATSTTNAVAGTVVNLTSLSSLTASTHTFTPSPLSLSAGNGFYWSASNDNVNFTNLSAVTYSSVTYSAAGNSIWDFGTYNYKYLVLNFKQPTAGGIALTIKVYGKKD